MTWAYSLPQVNFNKMITYINIKSISKLILCKILATKVIIYKKINLIFSIVMSKISQNATTYVSDIVTTKFIIYLLLASFVLGVAYTSKYIGSTANCFWKMASLLTYLVIKE